MIDRCDKCGTLLGENNMSEPKYDKHYYVQFDCPKCGQIICVNKELLLGKPIFHVEQMEKPGLPMEKEAEAE